MELKEIIENINVGDSNIGDLHLKDKVTKEIIDQAEQQIISWAIDKLKITPMLLKNRPGELHWGIYLGKTKEEAIEKLKELLSEEVENEKSSNNNNL